VLGLVCVLPSSVSWLCRGLVVGWRVSRVDWEGIVI
jgi:hypothetical protein